MDLYLHLSYFVIHGEINENIESINQNENEIFEEAQIPKLFDQSFLSICFSNKSTPDTLYYQLQLILNALDEKQKATQKNEDEDDFNSPYIKLKSNFNFNQQVKKITFIHRKFNDRIKLYNLPIKERTKNDKLLLKSTTPADKYWNLPDKKYKFKNGILYNKSLHNQRNKKYEDDWIKEMTNIRKKCAISSLKNQNIKEKGKEGTKMLFYNPSLIKDKIKPPNKIFTYDFNESKWKFNENNFINFGKESSINTESVTTHLVLFLNSFDQDSISVCSKLITHPYPELNENPDEVYVYAFCDRFLPYLNYYIDFYDKGNFEIKPIFLNLHVSTNKLNHPDIRKIVTQIYSFLSYICDIQIVILNSKSYKDQVEVVESINNIYSRKREGDSIQQNSSQFETHNKNNNNNDDDETITSDEDDDDDDFIDDDDDFADKNDDSNFYSNLNFLKSSPIDVSTKTVTKKSKMIILTNDSTVQYDEQFDSYLNQSLHFNSILMNLLDKDSCRLHCINTNDSVTYQSFLLSLKEFCIQSDSFYSDTLKSFKFVQMSELSNTYIQIKSQQSWQNELEKMINNRASMFNTDDYSSITNKLCEELELVTTPYDSEFNEECNRCLININKKDDPNRENIADELEISSDREIGSFSLNADFEYLQDIKVKSMIESYIHFIKEEYFDIIKYLSNSNNFVSYYEINNDILEEQIEKGKNEILKIFNDKKPKLKIIDTVNVNDFKMSSANYEIRQQEKLKQIKVQIETNGDLKDEIDQDF